MTEKTLHLVMGIKDEEETIHHFNQSLHTTLVTPNTMLPEVQSDSQQTLTLIDRSLHEVGIIDSLGKIRHPDPWNRDTLMTTTDTLKPTGGKTMNTPSDHKVRPDETERVLEIGPLLDLPTLRTVL
jgi:hypothetical protein